MKSYTLPLPLPFTDIINSAFHPSGVGKSSTGLSGRVCLLVSGDR